MVTGVTYWGAASKAGTPARTSLRAVLLLGCASAALYGVVYLAQRGLFLNGVAGAGGLATSAGPRPGTPADGSRLLVQGAAYYAGTLALFALYGWLLLLCQRGRLAGRAARLALLWPILFNLGLLVVRPTLSRDLYTYVAHGYLGLTGGNPYAQPASEVAATPFGANLLAAGWLPWHGVTPYGPIWTGIEIAALRLAHQVGPTVLLLKTLAVAASLTSAWLIWRLLGHVRPQDQLFGTLLYLWNPLIILELAGDGHNDALMIACTLAALLAAVRLRPAGGLAGLALGALVKFWPLMLLPAYVVYLHHARRGRRDLAALFVLGILSLGLAVLLYRVFWLGGATFAAMPEGGQRAMTASLSGALVWGLAQVLPPAGAAWVVTFLLDGLFVAIVLLLSQQARNADQFLHVCGLTVTLYLLTVAPVYWPWYATLPIALLALTPRGGASALIVALALGARLVAPLDVLYENHFITWPVSAIATTLVGVVMPLATLLAWWARHWRGAAATRLTLASEEVRYRGHAST
jgi:alpha-1,6-mannosyltransferase